MITKEDLEKIGFKETPNMWVENQKNWTIGEEEWKTHGKIKKVPSILYELDKQSCLTIRDEFCIISRTCKTKEDIIKFIECINFLFNLSIEVNA